MTNRTKQLGVALAAVAVSGTAWLARAQQPTTAPAAPVPAPAPAPAAPAAQGDEFAQRYALLADKNIFVRNRPPTRSITNRGPETPRRAEEAFLLTGIAMQEGRHVAFIENTASGTTQRLLPGDPVAGGKVVAVEFDALEFEANGRTTRIGIGRNLLGDRFTPTSTAPGSTTAPAGANGGSAAAAPAAGAPAAPLPGDANLSPEERMKLRRQQMTGGQ
jgi:hypothetical protein